MRPARASLIQSQLIATSFTDRDTISEQTKRARASHSPQTSTSKGDLKTSPHKSSASPISPPKTDPPNPTQPCLAKAMPSDKITIMLVILKTNPDGSCIFFINTDKIMPGDPKILTSIWLRVRLAFQPQPVWRNGRRTGPKIAF